MIVYIMYESPAPASAVMMNCLKNLSRAILDWTTYSLQTKINLARSVNCSAVSYSKSIPPSGVKVKKEAEIHL